jgi:tRNA threonylcarbamoyladenosine biosynthesis protein TsaE
MGALAMSTVIALADLDDTCALGARIAAVLRARDVVALSGALGAGKTELARAIIRAAAEDPELAVPSPTFTLVETYDTPVGTIWHFDLYRIAQPDEAYELGLEEALAEGIALIEWPGQLGRLLPSHRLDIILATNGEGEARQAAIEARGSWDGRLAAVVAA